MTQDPHFYRTGSWIQSPPPNPMDPAEEETAFRRLFDLLVTRPSKLIFATEMEVEEPQPGYGKGGFVVISAEAGGRRHWQCK